MFKQQLKKVTIVALLICGAQQVVFSAALAMGAGGGGPFDPSHQEMWRAANYVRNVVGQVGQCVAGYTLYETIKKVGARGTMNMLTSKPIAPLACAYLVSSVVNYGVDRYLQRRGYCGELVNYGTWKYDWDKKERIAFASKVLTGWLWAYSIMNFLVVAQPMSVSNQIKMFS